MSQGVIRSILNEPDGGVEEVAPDPVRGGVLVSRQVAGEDSVQVAGDTGTVNITRTPSPSTSPPHLHPLLIHAGYADLHTPIPWSGSVSR